MKILVDCATAKVGGAWTYVEELLKALAAAGDGNRWIVYTGLGPEHPLPRVPDSVEIRRLPPVWARPAGHLIWLAFVLPRQVRAEGLDAVFAATGFGMPWPACLQVILVRNPIYFSEPYARQVRSFFLKLDLALRRWICLRMIRSSSAVLFPTQAMADLVSQYLPLKGSRAVIAPYGCDLDLFRPKIQDSGWFPAPVLREKGGFLLNVSLYCAQKNFTVLFKALALLREKGSRPLLVLTTRLMPAPNSNYEEDSEIIARERLQDQVLPLGPVPRDRLPALYQAAGLFVFPSYVESFGHPLVEAMAGGLPILAADTPVNREVCGPAAVYAPAFDPERWAAEIQRLLGTPQERARLREAALERASRFSWAAHVQAIVRAAQTAAKAPS